MTDDVPELEAAAPVEEEPADELTAEEALADAAAAALARAREVARAAGLAPGRVRKRRPRVIPPELSSARADGRDPVLLGDTLARLVAAHGWEDEVAVGSVVARWPAIIGPEIAQHVTPDHFEDGILTVRADSTAWATELRYQVPVLLERLQAEVGESTVTEIVVLGPVAPSWKKGRRVAPGGRGPRDTYG